MGTIFKTNKYEIKTFTMDNFDEFCKLNQDPIVSKYVNHNGGKPKTFKECIEKYNDITYAQEKFGYSYWAIYNNVGNFIGQCGALKNHWDDTNNFCYAFKKNCWGKGIGTEVCFVIVDYLFKNFSDINKLETTAVTSNVASIKILKKIGFVYLFEKDELGEKLQSFKIERRDYNEKNI